MSNVDCGSCPNISDGCHGLCEKIELDVKRWNANWHMEEFYQSKHGDYVRVADYYAAQSELAALREELAEIKESLAYRGSLLNRTQLRAEAAEQRNAIMTGILVDVIAYIPAKFTDIRNRCFTALKPTESGASE